MAPATEDIRFLLDDLRNLKVRFLPVPCDPSFAQLSYCAVAREIWRGKYDLVHSHGFTAGSFCAFPSMLRKIPHVMTNHDVFSEAQFQNGKGILRKLFLEANLPAVRVIHNVSFGAKKNLLRHILSLRPLEKKLIVIPNGIEIERFKEEKVRDLRGELGLPQNTFLIGFLGRFMSQKGFRYLVGALEILRKDMSLPAIPVVIAVNDGGFVREERESVRSRGLEEQVRFLPFVPDPAATIKGFDVIAMPSLWEACGLLSMEAMVSGIPFIGTDVEGLREFLVDTPARSVAPADEAALAHAIRAEMLQPSKEAAKDFSSEAARRFDVRMQARELERLFTELAEEHRCAS
jgi:glycosyltransferase involved in cell wall biosynthesis